jgi:fructokinase
MIVVTGEALIDLIPSAADQLSVDPGGGPFNTARWLAGLGQPVAFLGTLAHDPLGERLSTALADAGVSLELAVETELPTTLALAQLDAAGVAVYRFYADATSVRGLTAQAVDERLPERLTALHVGGVALALAPSAMALERAAQLARQRGALVLFDPNIRSGLIPDREEYMRRFERVLEDTDVIKLSVQDLAWLSPSDEIESAVAQLLGSGPSVVLLTHGAGGADVYAAGERSHVPAEEVAVADTIGAGDAFAAGFLAHLLHASQARDSDPIELLGDSDAVHAAARFGAHTAGLACRQRGAKPPATLPIIVRPHCR